MRKSKEPKTAFDVAHVDIGESPAGWVYRSNASAPAVAASDAPSRIAVSDPAPQPPPERQSADEPRQWMATGARVMVFPLACAMVAMAAPILWLLAPRTRQ